MDSQNVLVVDWDYFFPIHIYPEKHWELYDWGHSEMDSLYFGPIWMVRAAQFDYAGIPRPTSNTEYVDWWERFDIDDDAVLYYADSNSKALNEEVRRSAAPRTAQVWLYDAHHDSGYKENRTAKEVISSGKFSCEDWMVGYRLFDQSELHVRYPAWKAWAMEREPEPFVPVDRQVDDGKPNDVHFDTIFVCRSGAWVPPWEDGWFEDFIMDAPVSELIELAPCEPREWDEEQVQKLVKAHASLEEAVRQKRTPGSTE